MEPNLAGSIYVRSSIKHLHLVPFGQQTWPPRIILFSDWLMLKKSSPLKQLGQMEPNMAGSIYVRYKPGIDDPWVCPFQNCVRQPHPPFKMAAIFSSPGHRPCELLSWVSVRRPSVSFSHLNPLLWNRWTDFNQTCQKCSLDGPLPDFVFGADLKSNMAARVHNVFSLAEIFENLLVRNH